MINKDPFGMQKPAQQFRSMLEIQRGRADKAEAQRDKLAAALEALLNDCGPDYIKTRLWDDARFALQESK